MTPDGEVDANALPAWRRWSGVAVIAVLSVTLVVQSWGSTSPSGSGPAGDPSSLVSTASVPMNAAIVPDTSAGDASPLGSIQAESTQVTVAEDNVVVATRAALTAWGDFASTGDLLVLEGTFDLDGLQYAQLTTEAETILNSGPLENRYTVTLADPVVERTDGAASVTAEVTFSRTGQDDQTYLWILEMVEVEEQWLLSAVNAR